MDFCTRPRRSGGSRTPIATPGPQDAACPLCSLVRTAPGVPAPPPQQAAALPQGHQGGEQHAAAGGGAGSAQHSALLLLPEGPTSALLGCLDTPTLAAFALTSRAAAAQLAAAQATRLLLTDRSGTNAAALVASAFLGRGAPAAASAWHTAADGLAAAAPCCTPGSVTAVTHAAMNQLSTLTALTELRVEWDRDEHFELHEIVSADPGSWWPLLSHLPALRCLKLPGRRNVDDAYFWYSTPAGPQLTQLSLPDWEEFGYSGLPADVLPQAFRPSRLQQLVVLELSGGGLNNAMLSCCSWRAWRSCSS